MDWKDEEAHEAMVLSGTVGHGYAGMKLAMTRAVELAASRGGTMTAERHALVLGLVEVGHALSSDQASELLASHDALGARVAVLEAEAREANSALADHSACLTRLSTVLGVVSSFQEIERAVESLKERLSAAEESNRELVRRAQQAEAETEQCRRMAKDMNRRAVENRERAESAEALLGQSDNDMSVWRRRVEAAADELGDVGAGQCGRLDIVTRVRMLKARCAALSAAGQVLSAHVDKAGAIPDMTMTCMFCSVPHPHRFFQRNTEQGEGWRCSSCGCLTEASPVHHPCTHDDAATSGHPDRMKERSEAFMGNWHPLAKHREVMEAMDKAAEAMRAACLNAVQLEMERRGASRDEWEAMKSAIEGAAP